MAAQTYSFLDVHAAIAGPGGGFSLNNGAAEEGISVAFNEDKNTMLTGADGQTMHSLKATKSGRISVRLLKTSPVNAQLTALYNFQSGSSSTWGQNTMTVVDVARGDIYTCQNVAFKKHPDNVYGKEGNMLVWDFDVGVMDPLLGTGTPSIAG